MRRSLRFLQEEKEDCCLKKDTLEIDIAFLVNLQYTTVYSYKNNSAILANKLLEIFQLSKIAIASSFLCSLWTDFFGVYASLTKYLTLKHVLIFMFTYLQVL